MSATWWSVALAEEVTGDKPLSVDIGDQPLVLWRDAGGVARALEDRCPHRRAPLSLGCVRSNGWLQCGYHGWSYDGETGRLMEIPNMKDDQRFPPLYRARRFPVVESGGFVRVSLDADAAPPPPTAADMPLSGTSEVSLDHRRYIDALYDDPGLLIDIRGVVFTPYLMSEANMQDGRLTMERCCQWGRLSWPAPFRSDFPITLLIGSDPETGESDLVLRDPDLQPLFEVSMAPVPQSRGVTAVRWRAKAVGNRGGLLLRRGAAFTVREAVDGRALRTLKATVSTHCRQLTHGAIDRSAAA